MQVKCIAKKKDKNGVITQYKVQDINGKVIEVTPQQLKDAIKNKKVECVNLTLTSNNRLVNKAKYVKSVIPSDKKRVIEDTKGLCVKQEGMNVDNVKVNEDKQKEDSVKKIKMTKTMILDKIVEVVNNKKDLSAEDFIKIVEPICRKNIMDKEIHTLFVKALILYCYKWQDEGKTIRELLQQDRVNWDIKYQKTSEWQEEWGYDYSEGYYWCYAQECSDWFGKYNPLSIGNVHVKDCLEQQGIEMQKQIYGVSNIEGKKDFETETPSYWFEYKGNKYGITKCGNIFLAKCCVIDGEYTYPWFVSFSGYGAFINNCRKLKIKNDSYLMTTLEYAFNSISLEYVDLSEFDASRIVDMEGLFGSGFWFKIREYEECSIYSKLKVVKLGKLDTTKVKNMCMMFANCCSLTEVDLNQLVTPQLEDISFMFSGCCNLENIDMHNFDTSRLQSMVSVFEGCEKLKKLELSNFTINTTIMDVGCLFSSNEELEFIDLSKFDLSKTDVCDEWLSYSIHFKKILLNYKGLLITLLPVSINEKDSIVSIKMKITNPKNLLVTLDKNFFKNIFCELKNVVALELEGIDESSIAALYKHFNLDKSTRN